MSMLRLLIVSLLIISCSENSPNNENEDKGSISTADQNFDPSTAKLVANPEQLPVCSGEILGSLFYVQSLSEFQVCSENDGLLSYTAITLKGADGINCSSLEVESGLEIKCGEAEPIVIKNGSNGTTPKVAMISLDVGSAECPNGGQKIIPYLDNDNDNQIDPGEEWGDSSLICVELTQDEIDIRTAISEFDITDTLSLNQDSQKLVSSLNFPAMLGNNVGVTWLSDTQQSIGGDGSVYRHLGFFPKKVSVVAVFHKGGAVDTKVFNYQVIQLPSQKFLGNETMDYLRSTPSREAIILDTAPQCDELNVGKFWTVNNTSKFCGLDAQLNYKEFAIEDKDMYASGAIIIDKQGNYLESIFLLYIPNGEDPIEYRCTRNEVFIQSTTRTCPTVSGKPDWIFFPIVDLRLEDSSIFIDGNSPLLRLNYQ